MVACCDVAIASASARFALTEVRWGVIPAPIIPQLCAAMGVRSLRRYAITGKPFDAEEARRIGLIHEVCADDALDQAQRRRSSKPKPEERSGGRARDRKLLVLAHAGLELSDQQVEALAVQAAARRASAEAAEGLASFPRESAILMVPHSGLGSHEARRYQEWSTCRCSCPGRR